MYYHCWDQKLGLRFTDLCTNSSQTVSTQYNANAVVERQLLGQMIMQLQKSKSEAALLKSTLLGEGKIGGNITCIESTGVEIFIWTVSKLQDFL